MGGRCVEISHGNGSITTLGRKERGKGREKRGSEWKVDKRKRRKGRARLRNS